MCLYGNSFDVTDVARDEGQAVVHGGCGEKRVDYRPQAFARPLAPEPGGCGINRQNAIGKAELEALKPNGQ
jgi:hypothetical protein